MTDLIPRIAAWIALMERTEGWQEQAVESRKEYWRILGPYLK